MADRIDAGHMIGTNDSIDTGDSIDSAIREALRAAAPAASPEGVAERIARRLAAGERGTPALASDFAGASWPLWAGALAAAGVAGAVGATLGLTGLLGGVGGSPVPVGQPGQAPVVTAFADTVAGSFCPAGSPVVRFAMGERVFITARTEQGDYVQVRHPLDRDARVWVPATSVEAEDVAVLAGLPVGGCEVLIEPPSEQTPDAPEAAQPQSQTPAPRPTPAPTPTPAPPADTTPPAITNSFAAPTVIYQLGAPGPTSTTIFASASDDVGVASIRATWPAHGAIAAGDVTIGGASGSFVFGPFPSAGSHNTVITLVAQDAAGNKSAPVTVTVTHSYWLN